MGLEALKRAEMGTLVLGLVAGALVALLHSRAFGAGIAVGAAWGAANLWALSGLLRQELARRRGAGSRRAWLFWGMAKFPILYGGGYLLLAKTPLPPASLLTGMAALFVVWTAEAAWRSFGVTGQATAGSGVAGDKGRR